MEPPIEPRMYMAYYTQSLSPANQAQVYRALLHQKKV